jgi:hypothetical protein
MSSSLLVVLGLMAAQPSPFLGVVRSPRGEVSIVGADGEPVPAHVGASLRVEDGLEVGEGGWAELFLLGDARVRLSGGTRVQVGRDSSGAVVVELQSGRLWAQKSGANALALEVHSPGLRVEVLPSSSVVVEHTTLSSGSCVVRAGQAQVTSDSDAPVLVKAGMIARRSRPGEPRIGGQTIGDLVSKEARVGLGDLSGLTAFIIHRTLGAQVADVDIRGVERLFQGDAQLMGGSYPALIVERAVRPPPFELTEVPGRGANVEVEVRFEDH